MLDPGRIMKPLCIFALLLLVFNCEVSECQQRLHDLSYSQNVLPPVSTTAKPVTSTTTKKSGGFFSGFKNIFSKSKSDEPLVETSSTPKTAIQTNADDLKKLSNKVPIPEDVKNGPTSTVTTSTTTTKAPLTVIKDKPVVITPGGPIAPSTTTTTKAPLTIINDKPMVIAPAPSGPIATGTIPTQSTTKSPLPKEKNQPLPVENRSEKENMPKLPTPSTPKSPVVDNFPALPTPKKPFIKEDHREQPGPATPKPQTGPYPWKPIPTAPQKNPVSFIPHQPGGSTSPNPSKLLATDEELKTLTEALFTKEVNQYKHVTLNLQGKTRSTETNDVAPEPLMKVSEQALQSPTIAKMRLLFNNYELDTMVNEYVTPLERKEENEFLDAVLATPLMRHAMIFLQNKGLVSLDPKTHRDLLKTIWFTLYSRGNGKIGSSAFEHVFLSEIKNASVIGLHNWVYYFEEEKLGHIDHKGYIKKLDLGNKATVLKTRFSYNGYPKPVNSLFVGTSPELELALYTVCFEVRPDKECPVSLGGSKFDIITHSWRYRGKTVIGSAYPEI